MTNKLAKIRKVIEKGRRAEALYSRPDIGIYDEALALLDSLSAPNTKEGQDGSASVHNLMGKMLAEEVYDGLADFSVWQDGDQWCATAKGFRNLQEDDAGFGDTPVLALDDLLKQPAAPAPEPEGILNET